MSDMLATVAPKSDQLNSDDLIGRTLTVKVTRVAINPGSDQPVDIHYEGDNGKPYRACKSMRRVLIQIWGADANAYVGRSMTLYRDPDVKWGGAPVGGIRISHMSDIARPVTMALTETKANRKPFTVKPLVLTDKAADGVKVLVDRIRAASDTASLEAITSDAGVVKQREWLAANRPELADSLTAALSDRLDTLAGADAGEVS